MNDFIAVTIELGNPKSRRLASLAADSCRWATGLSTFVVGERELARCSELDSIPFLKFRLFELFPRARRILYFDSDAIFLRKFPVSLFPETHSLLCVREDENVGIYSEARRLGISPSEYLYGGFLVLHDSSQKVLLPEAERFARGLRGLASGERVGLNLARSRLNYPTIFLPRRFNVNRYRPADDDGRVLVASFGGLGSKSRARIEATHRRYNSVYQSTSTFLDPLRSGFIFAGESFRLVRSY